MAKKLVRYKNVNGVLVKQYESPALVDGLVDITQLPIVGAMGSAVIENGSNANGSWVKWADGTMICESTIIKNGINVPPDQSIWISSQYVPPVAFYGEFGICIVSATASNSEIDFPTSQYIGLTYYDSHWNIYNTGNCGTHVHAGYAARNGGTMNVVSATIKVIAVGRWK